MSCRWESHKALKCLFGYFLLSSFPYHFFSEKMELTTGTCFCVRNVVLACSSASSMQFYFTVQLYTNWRHPGLRRWWWIVMCWSFPVMLTRAVITIGRLLSRPLSTRQEKTICQCEECKNVQIVLLLNFWDKTSKTKYISQRNIWVLTSPKTGRSWPSSNGTFTTWFMCPL